MKRRKWVRAERGGFLQFHVAPGDIVEQEQPLATNTSLLGRERSVLTAPFDGVVLGMTTLPAVSPGEPVCHLGQLPAGTRQRRIERQRQSEDSLEGRIVGDLATNVMVVNREEEEVEDDG